MDTTTLIIILLVVLLIGGGIMSATLGVWLNELEPGLSMEMVERLDGVAQESSNGWNNAGTGHSALAELSPHHNDPAHPPWPTRRHSIGPAGDRGQNNPEGGNGAHSRTHRWGAPIRRGIDEDGAGRRLVARTERGICS